MFPVAQYWHQSDCVHAIRARQIHWQRMFPDRYALFDHRTAADFLALHFGDEAVSGFRACAVPAMASDYFRYHWLAVTGGLYVDASFLPGDASRIRTLADHPVFALSVPEEDMTPAIVTARNVLGKVLLNGILFAGSAPSPYFTLISALIRALIHHRASDQIPMVTGIGVLTVFDYALTAPDTDGHSMREILQLAIPPGSERALAVICAFLTDNAESLRRISPATTRVSTEMAQIFLRPVEDHARLSDPAHWSNHRGSIYVVPPFS